MKIMQIFIFFFALTNIVIAAQCDTEKCFYNPRSQPHDDLSLPMPGGFEMVFKKVQVPDKEFLLKEGFNWSDSYMKKQDWYYFLGKYEVTIAQYLAVMGDGDLEKGFKNYFLGGKWYGDSKLKGKLQEYFQKNKKRQLYHILARPINALEFLDIVTFIDKYNRWCLNSEKCIVELAKLTGKNIKNINMYFRLPTEFEWEYAARGGYEAIKQGSFNNELPFGRVNTNDYAYTEELSKGRNPTIIGRYKPTKGGFYDLFGNVQELTETSFSNSDIFKGIGVAYYRGGSFLDNYLRRDNETGHFLFSTGMRGYVSFAKNLTDEQYKMNPKSHTTGIRLAIAPLFVHSLNRLDTLYQYDIDAQENMCVSLNELQHLFDDVGWRKIERTKVNLLSLISLLLKNSFYEIPDNLFNDPFTIENKIKEFKKGRNFFVNGLLNRKVWNRLKAIKFNAEHTRILLEHKCNGSEMKQFFEMYDLVRK